MKTQLLFVAFAGLTLVSASPPPGDPIPWEDEESLAGYPPCSRTVTDRCIQTNERGSSASGAVARSDEPVRTEPPRSYAAASTAAAGDYPPCSRTVTDRCIQTNERGAVPTRMARSAPKQKYRSAPVRLAMHAGERG